jgi:pilus assembly protein CpaB
MRARTLLLLGLAVVIAGGTAVLTRSWLAAQRLSQVADAVPLLAPRPARSVLVARAALTRGQILRPENFIWQVWPDGDLDKNYVVLGGPRSPEAFAGWVVKHPVAGGEPVTEAKIIAPGDRGFLAAVLSPGMRAISVPVTVTSGISGFVFPGDRVDLLLSYKVPAAADGDAPKNYEHKASQTVLQDIRVIGIDQRLDGKPGEAVVAHTATFEVTPKQSEIIAVASEIGKVSLSLRSLVPAAAPAEPGAEPDAVAASQLAADSVSGQPTTVTLDSDISPLLPKRLVAEKAVGSDFGGPVDERTQPPNPVVVTILRGKGRGNETAATQPAAKGL